VGCHLGGGEGDAELPGGADGGGVEVVDNVVGAPRTPLALHAVRDDAPTPPLPLPVPPARDRPPRQADMRVWGRWPPSNPTLFIDRNVAATCTHACVHACIQTVVCVSPELSIWICEGAHRHRALRACLCRGFTTRVGS